jgi:hypothetical protein
MMRWSSGVELDLSRTTNHDDDARESIRFLGGDYADELDEEFDKDAPTDVPIIATLSATPTMPCLIKRVINISMV